MAEPLMLLRQPETVTIDLVAGEGGARQSRAVKVRALRRDGRGPVLETLCAETGQPQSFPARRVAVLHHGNGRAESPEAFLARVEADREGAPPPARWLWIDRAVMLAIAAAVALATHAIQGPKDLGLYASFWSFALFLAGGLVAWMLLKALLGLPRPVRRPHRP